MSGEDRRELDDELLADDFAHFLTRGMAAQRAVDEEIANVTQGQDRTEETIGQLHDSLTPGEVTYRRLHGQTWEITRLPVPAARCSESWADEQGCASVDNIHRCGRDAGRHRCHSCISCDAMVIEDAP